MSSGNGLLLLGLPLHIDTEAFNSLSRNMQDFITDELKSQCAAMNGFLWDRVTLVMCNQDNVMCTWLCAYGSPSRDTSYIWVYNSKSCLYEMYSAPYFPPVSEILGMDTNGPIRTTATFDTFIHHIQHHDVCHMESCNA